MIYFAILAIGLVIIFLWWKMSKTKTSANGKETGPKIGFWRFILGICSNVSIGKTVLVRIIPVLISIVIGTAVYLLFPEWWEWYYADKKLFIMSLALIVSIPVSSMIENWWTKWFLRGSFIAIIAMYSIDQIPEPPKDDGDKKTAVSTKSRHIPATKTVSVYADANRLVTLAVPREYIGYDWSMVRDPSYSYMRGNSNRLIGIKVTTVSGKTFTGQSGLKDGKLVSPRFENKNHKNDAVSISFLSPNTTTYLLVTFTRR